MERQIFITVEGGLIQNIEVTQDLEDVQITVIDFEVEGIDEKDLLEVQKQPAFVFQIDAFTTKDEDLETWEDILEWIEL